MAKTQVDPDRSQGQETDGGQKRTARNLDLTVEDVKDEGGSKVQKGSLLSVHVHI